MKKRIKFIGTLIVLFFFLIFNTGVSASELNFGVSAVIPENQIDKNQTYFDLRMEPNEEQTLEVNLRNDTKEDVVIHVDVNTAMTNNNGVIDYSQTDFERDDSLEIDIEDLVEYDQEVTIEAESTKTFEIHLNMPDEEIDGILLGGIYFQEKENEDSSTDEGQISNKFAYVIGLKLSMNDTEVHPELTLNAVQPTQVNYRNVVTANIQNTKPVIVSSLKVNASIFKENGQDPLYTSEKDDLRMAPHSNFDYAIPLDNQEFKPGKYRVEVQAKTDEGEWEWTEYFTIEKDEAKEYNEQAVDLKQDYTTWYIVGGIIALIILLAVFYWLGTRKRTKE